MNEEAIFVEAIEKKTPEERAAYLNEACGDNEALRVRVNALLQSHETPDSLLDNCPPGLDDTLDHPQVAEGPGTIIGPYKLLQQIGEGGMGVVYLARQKEPVRRQVALKIIKPGMDTEQVIARFEAERQALAMMDHPNIAHVLDAGTTDSGRPYFVMELVKGVPVVQYCDEQQLTPYERLELFVSICQAVQHAHQKGIIHRDIKPSNVLVAEYDHRAVPKIIDFGVAKALHRELTEKSVYTLYGQIVGTLEYMSPEQAKLNQLDIDTRSDVYSLGVLLYELLTGSTPLTKKQLLSVGHDEMLRLIRDKEPEKPSTRLSQSGEELPTISRQRRTEPKKLGALVRGELDWIVMKSLEKDRNRRYETSLGLAADVRRFLDNEPVEACPPSKLYRLKKVVSRNKAAALSSVAIAVAILFGVLGITVGLWHARETEKAAAELARRQAFEYGINLAYEAWNRGNRNEFEQLMQNLATEIGDEERRGFEWRYLWARYRELSTARQIHTSARVRSVSYHPNRRHLAIGCAGGKVIVRDCINGESIPLPEALAGSHVAFSPKGTYLATSHKGFMWEETERGQLWHFPSFERVVWPEGQSCNLSSVVFSSDEALLAGGRPRGAVEIRKVLTGELVAECPGHVSEHPHVFSPDGSLLASEGGTLGDSTVQLWSTTGELLDTKPSTGGVFTLAFAPDGHTLIVGADQGTTLWQVTEHGLQDPVQLTENAVYALALSRDGILALGSADQTVRIWDLRNLGEISRLLHTSFVHALAFSETGEELAAGTHDNVVHLWDAPLWRPQDKVRGAPDAKRSARRAYASLALAISPSGEVATSEDREGRDVFKLWNPQSGVEQYFWTDEDSGTIGAAFSPDGNLVASVSEDGTVRIGLVKTGELLVERTAHTDVSTCVSFSPDSKTLVTGGKPRELFFWNVESVCRAPEEYAPDKRIGPDIPASLSFSPRGHLAVAGGSSVSQTGEIIIWDTNGELPKKIAVPERVRCVAYSPDGTRMAVTYKADAGIVHVLNSTTLETEFEFRGHSNAVAAIVFSPDGRRLITGSDDGTVRFWDLRHGRPVGTLRIGARVRNLAMLPDGNALVTASLDGWVRLWEAGS